jgi:hypothetical protein
MKRLIRDPLGWGINSGRVYPAHTNGTPHHDLQVTWLCLLPPGCVAIFCRRAWVAMWRMHVVGSTIGYCCRFMIAPNSCLRRIC